MTRRCSRVLLAVAPRVLVILMLAMMLLPDPAALAATPGPAGPQVTNASSITDGGFELPPPSPPLRPPWSAYLLDAGFPMRTTPLCLTSTCGENLARSGNGWVLFGGDVGPVQGAITQTVTIPPSITKLRFWVWLFTSSGQVTDTLSVLVDGHQVWQTDAMTTTYAMTYTLATANLATYADGAEHEIAFNSTTNAPDTGFPTTFMLDDVQFDFPNHVYLPVIRK